MEKDRDESVDILRGIAVLLMVFAHVIYWRYGLLNSVLNTILNFGNTFCYITFIFAFGIGSYFSMVKPWNDEKKRKMAKRVLTLVTVYLIAAFSNIISTGIKDHWPVVNYVFYFKQIILLQYFPIFTEYLPSFSIFTIVLLLVRPLLIKSVKQNTIQRDLLIASGLATLLNVGTNWLVNTMPVSVIPLRLLVGNTTSFDFPIFEYTIVLVLGLFVGSLLKEKKNNTDLILIWIAYAMVLIEWALVFSSHWTQSYHLPISWFNTMVRWPPSLLFIVSGLRWGIFALAAIRLIYVYLPWTRFLFVLPAYVGKHAMGYLLYHLLLLFAMMAINIPMFPSPIDTIWFTLVIMGTYYLGERWWTKRYSKIY